MPSTNSSIQISNEQKQQLQNLFDAKNYPQAYSYLRDIVKSNSSYDQRIANWFDVASHVNANDGSFINNFVRGATIQAAKNEGEVITQAQFQSASDKLAIKIIDDIIQNGEVQSLDDIVRLDVESVESGLHLNPEGWAGTAGALIPYFGLNLDLNSPFYRNLFSEYKNAPTAFVFFKSSIFLKNLIDNNIAGLKTATESQLIRAYDAVKEYINNKDSDALNDPLQSYEQKLIDDLSRINGNSQKYKTFDGDQQILLKPSSYNGEEGSLQDGVYRTISDADGNVVDYKQVVSTISITDSETQKTSTFTIIKEGFFTVVNGVKVAVTDFVSSAVEQAGHVADFLISQAELTAEVVVDRVTNDSYVESLIGSVVSDIILGNHDIRQIAHNLANSQLQSLASAVLDENLRGVFLKAGMSEAEINNFIGPKVYNYVIGDNGTVVALDVNGQVLPATLQATIYTAVINFAINALDSSGWNAQEYAQAAKVAVASAIVSAVTMAVMNAIAPGIGTVPAVIISSVVNAIVVGPLVTYADDQYHVLEDAFRVVRDAGYDLIKDSVNAWNVRNILNPLHLLNPQNLLDPGNFFDPREALKDFDPLKVSKQLIELSKDFVDNIGKFGGNIFVGVYNLFGSDFGQKLKPYQYWNPIANQVIELKADGSGYQIIGIDPQGVVLTAHEGKNDDLFGTNAQDILIGRSGSNTILGYDGNDHIEGRGDGDVLVGGNGDDEIFGGGGSDIIYGDAGNDTIDAGIGDDIVVAGAGNDIINGGKGSDQIQAEDGDDFVDGGDGDDVIVAGAGDDIVLGGLGDDIILGEAGDDIIKAGEGNDQVDGGAGIDVIFGEDGNDNLRGGDGDDEISGGAGVDLIYGDNGDDIINSGEDNDLVFGGIGNDIIYGNQGDDALYGEIGNDYLIGADGDDILDGFVGDDVVYGGKGNDTLTGGEGNDTFIFVSGDGQDTIDDSDVAGSDVVKILDINSTQAVLTKSGDDLILQFKDSHGAITSDKITIKNQFLGDRKIDRVEFADGKKIELSSVVVSAAGAVTFSTANYSNVDTAIQAEFALGYEGYFENEQQLTNPYSSFYSLNYTTTASDEITNERLNDVEWVAIKKSRSIFGGHYTVWEKRYENNLNGGAGNDRIVGNWWDETINSGDGDDQLSGNDGVDVIYGGNGSDAIYGGAGNDRLFGQGGNDKIFGQGDNDYIEGGIGNDEIFGGEGGDNILAQDGDDLVYGNSGDDQISLGAGNDAAYGDSGNDVINGDAGNDLIYGEIGNDIIHGGFGDDYISGGSGNDQLFGDEGSDIIYGDLGDDVIHGNQGNDYLFGDKGADNIFGDEGNDYILAGDGQDVVDGGAGNDQIKGGEGSDNIKGGDGNDIIYGESDGDVLDGGAGNDQIFGGTGNDILIDGAGSDVLNGGEENDILIITKETGVSSSIDVINGFNKDEDRIILKTSYRSPLTFSAIQSMMVQDGADVKINLDNGQKIIISNTNISDITANNFSIGLSGGDENQVLFGTSADDVLFGDDNDNKIYGGAGNDELWGGMGYDALYGEDGDDILHYEADATYVLTSITNRYNNQSFNVSGFNRSYDLFDGGAGYDVILMTEGNDVLQLEDNTNTHFPNQPLVKDVAVIFAGSGNDVVNFSSSKYNYENLIVYGGKGDDHIWSNVGNDSLFGQEGNDEIYGGAGNDLIDGGIGDDKLFGGNGNDTLDGGAGNDVLNGGGGDDILIGGIGADNIDGGDGSDTVSYVTSAAAVTIALQVSAATNQSGGDAVGDVLQNIENIIGSNFNDNLSGSTNSNRIEGGSGDDILSGGDGSDIYVYNLGDGFDIINEIAYSNDTIEFGAGISMNDLTFINSGNDLIIKIGSNPNDKITIRNQLVFGLINKIEYIKFADGKNINIINSLFRTTEDSPLLSISKTNIDQFLLGDNANNNLSGGVGDDKIYGGLGNDILRSGEGEDLIYGGAGSDWIYGNGQSNYLINKSDFNWQYYVSINPDLRTITNAADAWYHFTNYGRFESRSYNQNFNLFYSQDSNRLFGESGDDVIFGGYGDDYISGGIGGDALIGNAGNDQLFGDEGNDLLYGNEGDDVLSGGAGDDILYGSSGSDTYLYNLGDGNDIIRDQDNNASTPDKISFGAGITAASLVFVRSGNDLQIIVRNTAQRITIENHFNNNAIESLEFRDGSKLDLVNNFSYLNSLNINVATSDVAQFIGSNFSGNDLIVTKSGNNFVEGGLGSDVIFAGSGNDVIYGRNKERDVFGDKFKAVNDYGVNQGWATFDKYPRQMADVNGDGKADIVAFGSDGTYVSLSNGDGTFGAKFKASNSFGYNLDPSFNINPRILGDVNGDGRADVVELNYAYITSTMRALGSYIALGKADGSFDAPYFVGNGDYSGYSDYLPRKIVDFNGDGKGDLVSFADAVRSIPLNPTNNGFVSTNDYVFVSSEFYTGTNWTIFTIYKTWWGFLHPTQDTTIWKALDSADMNGDAKADIIGIKADGVYLSYSGAAATKVSSDYGNMVSGRNFLKLGDIDGNGFTDLVVFLDDGVYVSYNNGDGTFGSKIKVTSDFSYNSGWTSSDLYSRDVADINGDGKADIIGFASDGVYVLSGANLNSDSANTIYAGAGNDKVYGEDGADTIYGEDGNDVIYGGKGGDFLYGGAGSDILNDGLGADYINGGDGNDKIILTKENSITDIVDNFNASQDQIILKLNYQTPLTFANIQAAMVQNGADTEINLSGGYKVVIKNIDKSLITSSNFSVGLTDNIIDKAFNGNGALYSGGGNDIIKFSATDKFNGSGTANYYDDYIYYRETGQTWGSSINIFKYTPTLGQIVDVSYDAASDVFYKYQVSSSGFFISSVNLSSSVISSYPSSLTIPNNSASRPFITVYRIDDGYRRTYQFDVKYIYLTKNLYNGATYSLDAYKKTSVSYDGGAGDDALLLTDGNDFIALDDPTSARTSDGARIKNIETIFAGGGTDIINFSSTRYSYGDITIDGGLGNDKIWSNSGNDKLYGGEGDDEIYGGAGNDFINGGLGADNLFGGAGDDTYDFSIGDGIDVINEDGASGSDTIQFGAGISANNITLTKSGNNLTIAINAQDQITIINQFASGGRIEQFKFSDGSVINLSALTVSGSTVYLPTSPLPTPPATTPDVALTAPIISATAQHGSAAFDVNGNLNYTPNHNFSGTDTITYFEKDASGNVLYSKDYNVLVAAVNDAPTGSIADLTVNLDQEFTINLFDYFSDADGDDLTYLVKVNGSEELPDYITFDAVNNVISGSIGVVESLNFSVEVSDGKGGIINDDFTINSTIPTIAAASLSASLRGLFSAAPLVYAEKIGSDFAENIYADNQASHIMGNGGDDKITGSDFDDILDGGEGSDIIIGGLGNDVLTGGLDHDNFIFTSNSGNDIITDFGGISNSWDFGYDMPNHDSLRFTSQGMTADKMLLSYDGSNTTITFEGINDFSLTLQNFDFVNLDNAPNGLNNIYFYGQNPAYDYNLITNPSQQDRTFDSYDVINDHTNSLNPIWNINITTFLNEIDNVVDGLDNSNDTINAAAGNDVIRGKSGNDTLRGQEGNDQLFGDEGDDKINGGIGSDLLTGGSGNDIFVYTNLSDSTNTSFDTILDFVQGQDKIDLSQLNHFNSINDLEITYDHINHQTIIQDLDSDFLIKLQNEIELNQDSFVF